MRLFVFLLCSFGFLFSEGISSSSSQDKVFLQKLVLAYSKKRVVSEEELLKLKIYLIENEKLRDLQNAYGLKASMEVLGDYNMVVIKPIKSVKLRNELSIFLSPVFDDIFFVDYKTILMPSEIASSKKEILHTSEVMLDTKEDVKLFDEVGLQWLVIGLLALMGLIMSIISRRKLASIERNQEDINLDQKKIETEITKLGAQNA